MSKPNPIDRESLRLLIEDRSEPEPNTGCWLWMQHTNRLGYGRLKQRNRSREAHRVSYEAFVGPIPEGMDVLHRCDVRCCVNPDHLFLGTHLDNMRDMAIKWRGRRGTLPFGVTRSGSASNPFHAQIGLNGKILHLGNFSTAEEANEVATSAKKKMRGMEG